MIQATKNYGSVVYSGCRLPADSVARERVFKFVLPPSFQIHTITCTKDMIPGAVLIAASK